MILEKGRKGSLVPEPGGVLWLVGGVEMMQGVFLCLDTRWIFYFCLFCAIWSDRSKVMMGNGGETILPCGETPR